MTVLPINWTKTGDSSKPTYLTQSMMSAKRYCSQRALLICGSIFAILSSILVYYIYLSNLYLLDETYDFRGPKELLPAEKLTIRVLATNKIQDINRFVLHYSICPVVHEIQILWPHHDREPPHTEAFKYTTTHSKVRFVKLPQHSAFETFWAPVNPETEGQFVELIIDLHSFRPLLINLLQLCSCVLDMFLLHHSLIL